jgi:predicted phosphodiesterase
MHDEIEEEFPLPDADIFLHTGDFTNHGSLEQLRSVNAWFGKIKHRFKHMLVIPGNHDVLRGRVDFEDVLTNVTVLNHEIANAVLQQFGLRVYGSPWCLWQDPGDPGSECNLYHKIPVADDPLERVDILMTHGPADGIFDTAHYEEARTKKKKKKLRTQVETTIKCYSWGSSADLNDAIKRARPRVHLFGHLHEQRGFWQRNSEGDYVGGVEYEPVAGQRFPTTGPPPEGWPCDLVSCNAMCNHGGHEEVATGEPSPAHIAGPARLILASQSSKREPWRFTTLSQ